MSNAFGNPYSYDDPSGQAPYGSPAEPQYMQGYPGAEGWSKNDPRRPWNELSIAGFVCAFLMAPLGLIFSIVALVQIGKTHRKGKGLAIAGTIVAAISTLVAGVLIVGLIALWPELSESIREEVKNGTATTRVCHNNKCRVCHGGECWMEDEDGNRLEESGNTVTSRNTGFEFLSDHIDDGVLELAG